MRPLGWSGTDQTREIEVEEFVGKAVQLNGGESGAEKINEKY